MSQYRYVGGNMAQILDTPYNFTRFGQLVELPDDLAHAAIEGRIALIPAADWEQFGVTPEELKAWGLSAGHEAAPDEFKAKLRAIWKHAHEHREKHLAEKQAAPQK